MMKTSQDETVHLAEIGMSDDTPQAQLASSQETAVTTTLQPRRDGPDGGDPLPRGGHWLVWLGNSFALLWIGAAGAFIWGYLGIQSLERLAQYGFGQLTGLAVFAIAPALLFIMCGLMAREVVRNAHNTRRVEIAIRRLADPAQYAQGEVTSLSTAVSGEVSESLDDKAALIAAAISDQSKMVAAAAELAASQASDSERRIRASVDDLHEAGTAVTERGDAVAAVMLERTDHLRDLSETLKERSENLDAAYVKHRQRLADAGDALREEQEKIATALDFHKAELETMATTARGGADALNDAARAGAAAFKNAVDKALARADEMADHVREETEHAAKEHESALARLVAAAQEAKEVSEAAIEAIEAQADLVSSKVEQTNEAAYEAARRSDEAFETRLAEADKLTRRASQVADETAATVKRRLEAVLAAAKTETETVERQLEAMAEKLEQMPVMARDRAAEASDALRRGLDGLNAAAMAAAEEAQEIDAAFQARIRQNYELLSDFMLRMGSVAGGRRAPDLGLNELPDPLARRNRPAARPEPREDAPDRDPGDEDMNQPLGQDTSDSAAEERQAEEPMPGPRASRSGSESGWRWKDLLSSMPPEEGEEEPTPSRRPRRKPGKDD